MVAKVYDNVVKSAGDDRLYRGLVLDNGLKVQNHRNMVLENQYNQGR